MKPQSLLVAALVAATALIASPAGATAAGHNDTLNDWSVYDARGDISWVGATYSDGFVGLGLAVVQPEPLSSYNWVNDGAVIIWDVATPTGTYDVFFDAARGTVFDPNFNVTCEFTPDTTDSGVYFAGFPKSCIGSPSVFKINGYLSYDDPWGGGAGASFDFAPDGVVLCCEVTETISSTPTPQPEPQPQPDPILTTAGDGSGYWMVDLNGSVYNFGGAQQYGPGPVGAADIEPTPTGKGYWMVSEQGEVHNKGDAAHYGNAALAPGEKAASLSATPNGHGYWVFTNTGRVLAFGTAAHVGDMGGVRLNGPVLDSVATPSGNGYYMVASDGGVFTFGDAKFAGSTGQLKLNQPVMSMAPDPDGTGYWLVASDGGIFAFESTFHGSMGATKLNKPVSGIVPGSGGYMMVAEDGGIFSFGNVKFHGSLGANPPPVPVVAVALKAAG